MLSTPARASETATGASLRALTLVEVKRLARHPVFVLGVIATAVFIPLTIRGTSEDFYNTTIVSGFFLGLFSMIAMFRLTRAMEKSEAAIDSTPASQLQRTRALCLASILPVSLGVVAFIATYWLSEASATWALAGYGTSAQLAIFFGNIVVACLGGPLLGVAAGRWWRFPGAVVVLTVAVLFWVLGAEGAADGLHDNTAAVFLHLSAPWTQFTSVDSDLNQVAQWRGSPFWHLGWTLSLCVLAVLGAQLKGAEGDRRGRLLRQGLVVGLVGLVFLALGVFLGPDHATMFTPDGAHRY